MSWWPPLNLPQLRLPQLPNPADAVNEVLQGFKRGVESMNEGTRRLQRAGETLTRGRETLTSVMARLRTAEQAKRALAAQPKSTQRKLTIITVRCLNHKVLLRVVRIPANLPGADFDRYLVIPTSATTWRVGDQQMMAFAWFLADHDEEFTSRCRCHDEIGLTAAQLRGESPPPHGVRVLAS